MEEAILGGATAVQLRAKDMGTRDMLEAGTRLGAVCLRHGVLFVVNDRLDVALACGADGVHLGPDDLPVAAARRIAGPGFIIGGSAGTLQEARDLEAAGASYLGVGSVFPTTSKADAGAPIGIEGLRVIVKAVRIPVVGIGGITANNAAAVRASRAVGVAVIGAVFGVPHALDAARALRAALRQGEDGDDR